MPNSARYHSLVSRLRGLKDRLMPKTRPLGNYTARENDLIRAYRLLAHAEFEAYFEDRAVQIANRARSSYLKRGRAGRALIALMTFSPLGAQTTPKTLTTTNFDDPHTRVQRVVSQFITEVTKHNHGIKEENILAMLYAIGVKRPEIDATFLNTLNSYARNRGASAHQSIHTQQTIDPVSEVTTVDELVEEIRKLDLKLQRLVS